MIFTQDLTFLTAPAMEKYRKEMELGRGSEGVVYRAIRKADGVTVALKKMILLSSRDGLNMATVREIKLLSELKHENLVSLMEVRQTGF